MANQYTKGKPNICFDCANAYADKCPYIKSGKSRIIRKCKRFVPDAVNRKPTHNEPVAPPKKPVDPYESTESIAAKLCYSRSVFAHMTFEQKIERAKERGYTLEIIDVGKRHKYRLIKDNPE